MNVGGFGNGALALCAAVSILGLAGCGDDDPEKDLAGSTREADGLAVEQPQGEGSESGAPQSEQIIPTGISQGACEAIAREVRDVVPDGRADARTIDGRSSCFVTGPFAPDATTAMGAVRIIPSDFPSSSDFIEWLVGDTCDTAELCDDPEAFRRTLAEGAFEPPGWSWATVAGPEGPLGRVILGIEGTSGSGIACAFPGDRDLVTAACTSALEHLR